MGLGGESVNSLITDEKQCGWAGGSRGGCGGGGGGVEEWEWGW